MTTLEEDLPRQLERLRGPVLAYCYRMLGSPHEAADAVQETMLRAWRSADRLRDPEGLRPWVFRIATNVCIDAANGRRRRALPMDLGGPGQSTGEVGLPLHESTWVQPIPTSLLDDDPLAEVVSRESVRLAFVAALQYLLPRQRAVLILRDVLGWRAAEVAGLLDTSVDAVNSTLRRARGALADARGRDGSPPIQGRVDERVLAAYVEAFERFDIDRIVSLLHHDVVVSMPPHAFWLRGAETFGTWLAVRGRDCASKRLELTSANGGPAIALFERLPDGGSRAEAIHVLEWRDDRVIGLHPFQDGSLVELFGLAV